MIANGFEWISFGDCGWFQMVFGYFAVLVATESEIKLLHNIQILIILQETTMKPQLKVAFVI